MIVPQSSSSYFADTKECICVHAADSAAMGWGPTSKDVEGDRFFRQRLTEFCQIDPGDIKVDKGQTGQPYYIYVGGDRCYVYVNGTVVCGTARHQRGKHGMMDDPQTLDCTEKHQQFAKDYKRKY